MPTTITTIAAENRQEVGKGKARALRRAGFVPAIIYGDKKEPLGVALSLNDFNRIYHKGRILTTLLDIELSGKKQRVITRDVQLHPVRDTVIHIDFLRLNKDSKIAVEIPVEFHNEDICPGIKVGGVLNVVRYSVELHCPADHIPEAIHIDLKDAEMGDSIHISQVELPEGVRPMISDRDFTIATIAAPAKQEEEPVATEAEEGEEGAETAEGAETEKAEEENKEASKKED